MEDKVRKIADLLTDDPDIFNEMAVSTGGIAMGMGNVPRSRKKRKKVRGEDDSEPQKHSKYHANPVTGQPEKGEVLFSDEEKEESSVD